MKTIGIIGGTSWYSTADFYQYINKAVERRLGGNNCAKLVLANVNLQEILDAKTKEEKGDILSRAAKILDNAHCDYIMICSNGLHEYADRVLETVHIPLIHIADSLAYALLKDNVHCVGLLGAKDTMEADFYVDKLTARGIQVLIPELKDRDFMDHALFQEITRGQIRDSTKARFYEISNALAQRGAEAIIMGCTEIGEIMCPEETELKLYDTTQIQAEAMADLCVS